MAVAWTKDYSSSDDGAVLSGADLAQLQDDIDLAVAGALPTPGATDGLKLPRVKSDYSGYELVAAVPAAQGGTNANLSAAAQGAVPFFSATGTMSALPAGTLGQVLCSQGSATNVAFSNIYHPVVFTFESDSASQTIYGISPVTGKVPTGAGCAYICNYVSARGATYTVIHASAGSTITSATVLSTGVAGAVTTCTATTATVDLAVTAGEPISITRAACGTTHVSTCTLLIIKTP